MNCTNCGQPLDADASFCSYCGERSEEYTTRTKYCKNCGIRLMDEGPYCANCGHPVPGKKQPNSGKTASKGSSGSGKTTAGIIAGVGVVIAAIAAILAFTGVFLSPAQRFQAVVKQSVVSPLTRAVDKVLDAREDPSLSTDLNISASSDDSYISQFLEPVSLDLKVNSKKDSALINMDVNWMGSDVLSGAVTYDDDQVGVYLPDLDRSYYVMDMDRLIDLYNYADSGADYTKAFDFNGDLLRSALKKYSNILLSTINSENVTTERGVSVYLSSVDTTIDGVTAYTFRPTRDDVAQMADKLIAALEEDQQLRELMRDTYGSYLIYSGEASDESEETDWIESAIGDAIFSLRSTADIYRGREESVGLSWTIYMKGNTLYREEISQYEGDSYPLVFELYGKESSGITYCLGSYDSVSDAFSAFIKLDYQKKGSQIEGTLSYEDYYSELLQFNFDYNQNKRSALDLPYGTYRLDYGGITARLTVEKSGSETAHVLRLSGEELDYYIGTSDLEITILSTDRASTAKKPSVKQTDISDYSEDEFSNIFYNIASAADAIFSDLM